MSTTNVAINSTSYVEAAAIGAVGKIGNNSSNSIYVIAKPTQPADVDIGLPIDDGGLYELSGNATDKTWVRIANDQPHSSGIVTVIVGDSAGTVTVDNGTSGTGITQPTGGDGVLGWLSGSYNYLRLLFLGTGNSKSSGDIARPGDGNIYAAGDVVGGVSSGVITFSNVGSAGQLIRILSAKLRIDVAAVPSGMGAFKLHLYNVTPPSAYTDNTAWDLPSGDRAAYLGYLQFDTVADLGSTLLCKAQNTDEDVLLAGTSLFGYLVTDAPYTPTASTVKNATINFTPV